MENIVIWGAGGTAVHFLKKKTLYKQYKLIAFVDNNPKKWGTFWGDHISVISPAQLVELEFRYVVICAFDYEEIKNQLMHELNIEEEKILVSFQLEEQLKQKVISKYADTDDREIDEIVASWKKGTINIFGNYHCDEELYHWVYGDDENPYIIFEDKKMYFPPRYPFMKIDGKKAVYNLFAEQGENSPHLYLKDENDIKEKSVIVDAGVCEGNFALRYIDNARKVYLIESDPEWMNALKKTFSDYKSKVVFCNKSLGRFDSADTICLDTLVHEKIDFLKMDIEGAEVEAILGAKRVLEESDAKCALCSYHKQNDEKYLRFLLEAYGYHTETTKGYMFYIYDENISDSLDFRRGIVYGRKEENRRV